MGDFIPQAPLPGDQSPDPIFASRLWFVFYLGMV